MGENKQVLSLLTFVSMKECTHFPWLSVPCKLQHRGAAEAHHDMVCRPRYFTQYFQVFVAVHFVRNCDLCNSYGSIKVSSPASPLRQHWVGWREGPATGTSAQTLGTAWTLGTLQPERQISSWLDRLFLTCTHTHTHTFAWTMDFIWSQS